MIWRFTLPAVLATWRTQMVDLSADGKRLLVQCNESGTMQLFDVLLSTGERRRVTDLTEPVTGMYVPGGDGLVLQMDEGGDERFQLYRWQHEQLQPLSVHPGAMQILGAIDRAGMRLAYASNRRNLTDFDIYIRELHGEGEVCVYSAGGLCQVHDFSPDGRWLLLSRNGDRPMDNDLLLVVLGGSP